MHRLPRLLLLLIIVVASVVVSGYNRHAHANLARHSHVFDLFGFEAREEVAAVGEAEHNPSAAIISLQAPPTSAS